MPYRSLTYCLCFLSGERKPFMKKRLLPAILAVVLILSFATGCSKPDLPPSLSNDPVPYASNEAKTVSDGEAQQIYADIDAVNNSDTLTDISNEFNQTEDDSLKMELFVKQAAFLEKLEAEGTITDLSNDPSQYSSHYKVDGMPVTYLLKEPDPMLSGSGSHLSGFSSGPSPLHLTDHKPEISVPAGTDIKLNALIMSWDNEPFDRKSKEEFFNSKAKSATHWDLAQAFAFITEDTGVADIEIERADDFKLSALSPERLCRYDIIYFNTHGYLSGENPYMCTAELVGDHWEKFKEVVNFNKSMPSGMTGVEIIFNAGTSEFFDGYIGRYAVGGHFFDTILEGTAFNPCWVHIGSCYGMAGNNSLAQALSKQGAYFVSGYDDEEYKNMTYANLCDILPELIEFGTFGKGMETGSRSAAKHHINNDKAKLVWLSGDNDALDSYLYCGFRLKVLTDYYYPEESLQGSISLYKQSGKDFEFVSEKGFELAGDNILYGDLDYRERYKVIVELPNYERYEAEFNATHALSIHEITLTYEGGDPGTLMTPEGMNAVQVYVTDDSSAKKPLKGVSIQIFGKTDNTAYELLLDAITDENGDLLDYIPDRYTTLMAVVSREGYVTQTIESSDFKDGFFWQQTVRLKKGNSEPVRTPEPSESRADNAQSSDALSALLSSLTAKYGVIPIGTDYIDCGMEIKPIKGKTSGMLFADIDDYDRDRASEVLILRNDPSFPRNGSSNDRLIFEIYEERNGHYEFQASKELTAYGLSSTFNFHSMSAFKYGSENDYGKAVFIGLELYSQMNSQNTTVVLLHYDGDELYLLDGANYGEWDGSDDMRSSFAIPATLNDGLILERDGDGWNDWTEISGSGSPLDDSVLSEFKNRLRSFGLDLKLMRSIYSDYRGTNGVAKNAAYCGLTAGDTLSPYGSSEISVLGAISTEYAQGGQTLTRRDMTGLLDQYR